MQYFPNFIGPEEESNLMDFIDGGTWSTELKRRTQQFGYKYSYTGRGNNHIGPLPLVFDSICQRLVEQRIFPKTPDQVIVNEYLPGQGIAPHVDSLEHFGPVVCSLSLLSGIEMKIGETSLYLEPRSLLVLTGPARTEWKHGIASRKSDIVNGVKVPRSRRVSVTFRTVM